MPENQKDSRVLEQRVRASYRVRACAAGLCVGAQIFLAGCAVGMPLALSSAWLAALPSLLLCVWFTRRCHRALSQSGHAGRMTRLFYILTAAALLLCGAFACASMVGFAARALAAQTRTAWTALLAVIAILLCALPGGTGAARLCFALRYAWPALLLGLSLSAVPMRVPVGLFPILGAGAAQLGMAAACVLFGAAPALMLMLPPPEIARSGEAAQHCPIPEAEFFTRRVLLGALTGAALLFLSSACTTYESIQESTQWGARLRMAAGNAAHEGTLQMLLTVTKLMAMLLLTVNMLCAAEQALVCAFPALAKRRAGLIILLILLTACMTAMIIWGERPLLLAAPAIAAPAMLSAFGLGRRRRK